MDIEGKWRAFAETLAGSLLMSLPFWSKVLDVFVSGLHIFTAFCGAMIAGHGVWRLFFRTQRRRFDRG